MFKSKIPVAYIRIICCMTLMITSACTLKTKDEMIADAVVFKKGKQTSREAIFECEDIPQNETTVDSSTYKFQKICKLITRGFPKGKNFQFCTVSMDLHVLHYFKCIANDLGELIIIKDHPKPLSDVTMHLGSFMNGERVYYVIMSEDFKTHWSIILEPNPIQEFWDDGAKVSLEMLTPYANLFLVSGTNFCPDEELLITSTSKDEVISWTINVSSNGEWHMLYSPAVEGYIGGKVSYQVERKSMKKKRLLKFFWGDEALKHRNDMPILNKTDKRTILVCDL